MIGRKTDAETPAGTDHRRPMARIPDGRRLVRIPYGFDLALGGATLVPNGTEPAVIA